jgi:hypothetical protein
MAFPTTTLLDDFTRANNASLGANWTEGTNGKGTRAEIISNAVSVTGSGASSICAYTGAGTITSTWLAVQAKISSLSGSGVNDRIGLAVTKVSNTAQGYHTEIDPSGTDVTITFWNDATGLQIGSGVTAAGYGEPVANDLTGMIAHDNGSQVDLEFWISKSSVWTQVATLSASGGDYVAGPYYPSLRVKYDTEALDDFKAVAVTAPGGGGQASQFLLLGVG